MYDSQRYLDSRNSNGSAASKAFNCTQHSQYCIQGYSASNHEEYSRQFQPESQNRTFYPYLTSSVTQSPNYYVGHPP